VGARTASGKVLVPPTEYDPETAEPIVDTVEVSGTGSVERFAWVTEPMEQHPFDRPFAWALVRLDGADTSMLHALDVSQPGALASGMRVQVRWRAERTGHIADIECFEPATDSGPAPAPPNEATEEDADPRFMRQMASVEYEIAPPSPVGRRFSEQISAGRIVGHRCGSCGKVYVPPRGYCPTCVVPTDDEVEVADRGTVTVFTVITPIQYHGQEETEDYVQASVLLDGADQTIMTRLDGVPNDDVRMGLRVEAVWKPEGERSAAGGPQAGLAGAIDGWRATGEPDTPLDRFAEHLL
jgi:uncharacterized OB-fold protein